MRRILGTTTLKPYPLMLYKYRREITEWEEKTLLEHEIFLSSRDQFNDPMDIVFQVRPSPDDVTRWKRISDLVISQGGTYEDAQKIWSIAGTSEGEAAWLRRVVDGIVDRTGIYSFSETARSMLMWSHYAADHKGLCFQFFLPVGFEEIQTLLPVEYGTKMKEIEFRNKQEEHINAFRFKSVEWRYEQEWRIIKPNSARSILKLPPNMIKAVIFGAKCPHDQVVKVVGINNKRVAAGLAPLYLLQAQLSDRYYHVGISTHGTFLPATWHGRSSTKKPLGLHKLRVTHDDPEKLP
nr:DUF2971 domain-containing protein [Herbaspirillum sp. B39]